MKKLITFMLFVVFVCSCVPCLAGGAWISAIPEKEDMAKGEPIGVAIRLGWWEAFPGSALIRITYDSKLLQLESTDVLDEHVCSVNTKKGELSLVFCSTDIQSDTSETDLIRVVFKAIKSGKGIVSPAIISITDSRWLGISSQNNSTLISIK